MRTGGTGSGRIVMIGLGIAIAGVVVGVAMSSSADEAAPRVTQGDPVIAMPPPRQDFAGLAVDPPPVATTTTVTTATTDVAAPRTLRLSGAMTLEVEFTQLDRDRRTTYTVNGTLFGDVTGEWVEQGWEQYGEVDGEGHVRSAGAGTATARLTVPGVGTGRVNATNEWQSDNQGNVLGVSTIASGSGELAGVTGTMRWNTSQDGDALSYQLDLTISDP